MGERNEFVGTQVKQFSSVFSFLLLIQYIISTNANEMWSLQGAQNYSLRSVLQDLEWVGKRVGVMADPETVEELQVCPWVCEHDGGSPRWWFIGKVCWVALLKLEMWPNCSTIWPSCVNFLQLSPLPGNISIFFEQQRGFPGGSDGTESACSAGDPGSIPGWEDALEKEMAICSSSLAWRTPSTEKLGSWLHSTESQRTGRNWATRTHTQAYDTILTH